MSFPYQSPDRLESEHNEPENHQPGQPQPEPPQQELSQQEPTQQSVFAQHAPAEPPAPTEPANATERPMSTSHPALEQARRILDDSAHLPLAEQASRLEEGHRLLSEALATLDGE